MAKTSWLTGQRVIGIILIWNLLRLLLVPTMGLMPQDAYYFLYAEHPDLSYFDHPPMVAYMLYISKVIFGKHAFAIKLVDFAITAATQVAFYELATKFLSSSRSRGAALVFSTTVLVSILSIITTPDVPLMLFWTLTLLCLYEAIFKDRTPFWLLAGLTMGLAFDSKYTAVFLPIGLLSYLLISSTHRKYLATIWPYLSVSLMLICTLPVIIWNIENDFASFLFQANRSEAITRFSIHPEFFLGVLGHQAFILIPVVFVLLIIYLIGLVQKLRRKQWAVFSPHQVFLLSFFLPLWSGFLLISWVYWVKINWQMPAYITGIILVAGMLKTQHIKWHLILSALIHIALLVQILFYPVIIRSDDTWIGWEELATQVQARQENYPNSFLFSGDNYKTSAQLNFHLDKRVYARNVVGEPALQFDYLEDNLNHLNGMDALFIDSQNQFKELNKSGNLPEWAPLYFSSVEELNPIIVYKGSRPIRKYLVYFCSQYKALP
ncbi:MAG: glycosyltransferase family 39 protein [Saprospiraceae bacterium]|nr:glycosyltransferase family 39 protein [Saprospiraceae bacterium]